METPKKDRRVSFDRNEIEKASNHKTRRRTNSRENILKQESIDAIHEPLTLEIKQRSRRESLNHEDLETPNLALSQTGEQPNSDTPSMDDLMQKLTLNLEALKKQRLQNQLGDNVLDSPDSPSPSSQKPSPGSQLEKKATKLGKPLPEGWRDLYSLEEAHQKLLTITSPRTPRGSENKDSLETNKTHTNRRP